MTDTLFPDISSFQVPVDDRLPLTYRVLSIRSNDGTYQDPHFAGNFAWATKALASGRLTALIVYFVYETNWLDAVNTHKKMVGPKPHPRMASMIDVESWNGKIIGNQSVGINGARENLIGWYGGNRKRVIGYANTPDFTHLWPTRGDARVILANYSANPAFPGKIAHQFASNYTIPPFGPCDINSADGLTPDQFAAALGIPPMTKPAAATPGTPYYAPPVGMAHGMVSNNRGFALWLLDDGRLEVRHNGQRVGIVAMETAQAPVTP